MQFTQGNLLEAPVDALVNTVNTVGVMGKGIALMFKERFPENLDAYKAACKEKQVLAGVRSGIRKWPSGRDAAERKDRLFDDKLLLLALERLRSLRLSGSTA